MYHALVHYPQIDTSFIENFRKIYNPYSRMIKAHITFLFNTPDFVDRNSLEKHIVSILADWNPFPIYIKGVHLSWDQFLYLGIEKGNDLITQLHDELYGGVLQKFLRKDLPFYPHIGLGIFSKQTYDPANPGKYDLDEKKHMEALAEAEKVDIGYECTIDRLTLISFDEEFKNFTDVKDFLF